MSMVSTIVNTSHLFPFYHLSPSPHLHCPLPLPFHHLSPSPYLHCLLITPASSLRFSPSLSPFPPTPPPPHLFPHLHLFHSSLLSPYSGPPNQPKNIIIRKISMDTVNIQWVVPLIIYGTVSYVAHFWAAPCNISQPSTPVVGNVTGGQLGLNLTGLVPSTLYWYTLMASNTEGTTTSPVMLIFFFKCQLQDGQIFAHVYSHMSHSYTPL